MAIAMDEEWVSEYLEETTCGNFNNLDMNLGDEETLLSSKGETRCTIYSPDHVLDLPNLFDGIDETLDAFDEVINVDQQSSYASEDPVRINLKAVYLARSNKTCSIEMDLNDLGTTQHMTGFFPTDYSIIPTPLQYLL